MVKVLTRRRSLLTLASLAAGAVMAPAVVRARSALPDKTLRILVGFVAGGGADTVARLIARSLERRTGRYVIVENRPGSAGAHPGELIMKGGPDGATVAMLASNSLAARLAVKDFPFDPLTDIAPIGTVGTFPLGFAVSPTIGVTTFAEYLDWLKRGDAKARRLGNTSSDAFIDVLGHTIGRAFDIDLRIAPYRGAAPMVNDLRDGRLPAAVTAATSFLQHHRGRRLRMLMTSGPERMRVAQDVPTARELGVSGLEMEEWYGVFASPETSPEVVAEWNLHLYHALADRNLAGELAQLGLEVDPSAPDELRPRLEAHLAGWRVRMKEAGMAPMS
jgi:tripartite-type tricarboxylate transporter receptor subunit TctC